MQRRQDIDSGAEAGGKVTQVFNEYTEFPEFSRSELKKFKDMFKKYDTDKSGFLDLQELKYFMEQLGEPQTHVALKAMIALVDEDFDGTISYREFLLIFRKAARGELEAGSGLAKLAESVNVSEEGVGGAKNFFEAKSKQLADSNKFENEIKKEQEAKKAELEAAKQRRADFKSKAATFQ
ncbi:EF-hand domain family [Capsaspora owczarzaki ATCC 30864]|uniref:EF-hand domain family n=1 Tax=Capsaspora owczarzaki (strain ATCC 30864) TaxID=595528 RepID=A0A0D2X1N0_CAPO3|nr:EF-hand domain family [Capsaspora owczarzaki ATCC 30864]KJE91094.1 EF-hand domain family [Capsaspora owczarzaki ATCC 30864]|eukprot:XP_004349032.2 EF-hand domain family [Capsaspora owczarzaki ATCC 30864]